MILYLWTAPGRDLQRGHSGVAGDQAGAQLAAEACLRTGQARLAYIEVAHTVIAAHTLNPCYMHTGAGWWHGPAPATISPGCHLRSTAPSTL